MAAIKPANELWLTAYYWLQLTGQQINKKYSRQEISTHPDYPALTSLTDFLDAGGMAYNAVQADASYIHEFNYPLLAHIKQPGNEQIHIINKPTDWDAQKELTQHWSGVVIYPEPGSRWQHKDHETYSKIEKSNKLNAMLLFSAAFIITVLAIVNNPVFSYAIMGCLSLAGLLISILITATELGVQNSLVKQVCGAVSKAGCDGVLKTSYAKGVAGLTTGDIAMVYFASQWIMLIAAAFNPFLYNGLLLFCLPGLLVAGWSIYLQAFKIKQWCALCLGLVAVLLLQFLTATVVLTAANTIVLNATGLLLFTGLLVLIALLLYPVKQLLKMNDSNAQKATELKKWKWDAALFLSQWQNEPAIDASIWQNDLIIGNAAAPVKITVACNPYCGPCAKTHKALDEILERHPGKLSVQMRFLCNAANLKDKRTVAVAAMLTKATELKNNNELQTMLSDWFTYMNYEKWVSRWLPTTNRDIWVQLQQHEQWVNDNNIDFTPTFFVNGKKLPGRYGLPELEMLLPQLTETLQTG